MIPAPSWLRDIRVRVLLALVLATIPILAVAVGGILVKQAHRDIEARSVVADEARQAANHLAQQLNAIRQYMSLVTQLVIRAGGGADTGKTVLTPALAAAPHFTALMVTDVGGTVVASSAPLFAPMFLGDRPYFIAQRRQGDFTIGDYDLSNSGRGTISFALPLRTVDPRQDGVLVALVELSWFSHLTERLRLGDDSLLTVFDASGTVLYRSLDPYHWIGQHIQEPHIDAMIAGDVRTQRWTGPGLDGVTRYYVLEPVRLVGERQSLGVVVGATLPTVMAYWTTRDSLDLSVVLLTLGGLYIGAWWLVGRDILRPLQRVRQTALVLAKDHGDGVVYADHHHEANSFAALDHALDVVAHRVQRARAAEEEAALIIRLDMQRLDAIQQIIRQSTSDDGTVAGNALSAALALSGSASGWLAIATDDASAVTILAWHPRLAAGASLECARVVRSEALGPFAELLQKNQPMIGAGALAFDPDLRLAVEQPGWNHGYAVVSSSHHQDGPVLVLAVGDKNSAYTAIESRQLALLVDEMQHVFALRRRQLRQERRVSDIDHGRRIEALSRLAGAVAHDFNNQLSAIAGYADLLRRRADQTAFVRDAASRIDHAVAKASQLTSRLRAFAQNSVSGAQPCDLHRLLEQALAIVQPSFGTAVVVSQSLNATRTATTGDPARLVQVVVTLLARARDVMPDGGALLVTTHDVEAGDVLKHHELIGDQPGHDGRFLELSVTDHGPALDESQRQRLFEPFALTAGDGLGLATAYATIRDHGGAIAVASQAGVGTTITAFIPIRAITQPAEHDAVAPIPTQTKLRIMVVDNEISVRAVLVDQLEELGHSVIACDSGVAALDRLRLDPKDFDVVIVDLRMPGLNGAICTERIRELNADLPVLVCSGSSQEDPLAQEALRAGAVGFLRKPLRLADLSMAIHEIMRDKSVP